MVNFLFVVRGIKNNTDTFLYRYNNIKDYFNYEIIEYYNGKEISSFYSKVSLSPQDVKEYFDWLFIKGKYLFCGHPGGLFGP